MIITMTQMQCCRPLFRLVRGKHVVKELSIKFDPRDTNTGFAKGIVNGREEWDLYAVDETVIRKSH